jgi:hypothetical protein
MKTYEQTIRELQIKGYEKNESALIAFNRVKKNLENTKQRIYDRIYEIQKNKGYFITLTYKEEELNIDKAHKDLKTWCRENCNLYIGNIDFGDQNKRLHHHVACVPNHNELVKSWKYGAINIQKIHDSKKDGRKVVLYITKLVNHAIKETASYIVRSKKTKGDKTNV